MSQTAEQMWKSKALTCVCVQSTVYNCTDGLKHRNTGGFVQRPSRHVSLDVSYRLFSIDLI